MDFLSKIEPYLVSDDIFVQKLVLHILDDIHPFVPAEWTNRLLRDALEHKEKEFQILAHIDKMPINHEGLELLLQGLSKEDQTFLHLYMRLLDNLEPELALENQERLQEYIQGNDWDFYRFLLNGEEEETWEEFGSVLAALENERNFNHRLYSKAKQLARVLIQKSSITESEINLNLNEQLSKKYFGFDGILSIYMIRLLKLTAFTPFLVNLLDRDEDILLEEVADTLISFQSDEVVSLVLPYAKRPESSIFAIAIISGTKTAYATKVLKELFNEVEDEEDKSIIFEALCHQLTKEALPEIEQYLNNDPESYLIEIDETAYGYYKIIGENHPNLQKWKRTAEMNDEAFLKSLQNKNTLVTGSPIRNEQKVGRNDPCPCGSGKKYKKCCGAS